MFIIIENKTVITNIEKVNYDHCYRKKVVFSLPLSLTGDSEVAVRFKTTGT